MAKSHEFLLASAAALAALSLRLFPYLTSGVPYMTDTWPQVANAQALLANTPVPLAPGHGFDSYNIFWPGLTLFASVLSLLTGVRPLALMPVATPLVNSLAFLVLYALLRRMGLTSRVAFVASLLAGLGLATAILGAGATKEAFALPLLFSFVLLLVIGLEVRGRSFFILSFLAFVSLLLAHHLTSLVGLLVAVYLVAQGVSTGSVRVGRGLLAGLALIAAMLAAAAYYFFVHASSVVLFPLTDSAVVSILAYQLVFLLPVLIGIALMRSGRLAGGWSAFAFLSVVVTAAGATRVSVTADSPTLPAALALAFAPYIVMLFLGAYAVMKLRAEDWRAAPGLFAIWTLGVLGVAYFAAFGTAGNILTTLRIADFAYPALLVLGAVALASFTRVRGARTGTYLLIALLAVASVAGLVWTAYYAGPLGGNQRAYQRGDVSVVNWVHQGFPANSSLYGDRRFSYLYSVFPTAAVDVTDGYNFLTEPSSAESGCLLLSSLVSDVGYVFYNYGTLVPRNDVSGMANRTNISSVFDSGQDMVYCGA